MKRVMVDQGSAAEIMYPDLFKGLNLRTEDLTPYNSPLVCFEGKVIILKGQIRLPVQTGLGRTDTIITGREGILLSSKCQTTISWSELYSKNLCIKSWKRLRTNPSSNGPIR